jgi:hypothetical protein
MKKLLLLLPLALCTACLWQQPVRNTDMPDSLNMPFPTRVGKATSTTWFWMWETGDSSVKHAQGNGGIAEVSSITTSTNNYFGIIKRHITTVRGN